MGIIGFVCDYIFASLPSDARFAQEALMWYMERTLLAQGAGKEAADGSLQGIAAAPGRHTGTVRVINSEDEFGKLHQGDVMVCPITSPVWSMLFPSIRALVTDAGGILSHPAIIAREYQVPAVVATGTATSQLKDGQIVTVDGRTGLVEVES